MHRLEALRHSKQTSGPEREEGNQENTMLWKRKEACFN